MTREQRKAALRRYVEGATAEAIASELGVTAHEVRALTGESAPAVSEVRASPIAFPAPRERLEEQPPPIEAPATHGDVTRYGRRAAAPQVYNRTVASIPLHPRRRVGL